jgi:hypothetical protein
MKKPSLSILLGASKPSMEEEGEGSSPDVSPDSEETAMRLQEAIKSGTPSQVVQLMKILINELIDI